MTTNEFDTHDGKYTIRSFGNGWAYEVIHNPTGDTLWFQDHDADQLQTDTNNFEDDNNKQTTTMTLDMYFEMIGS